MSTIRLRQREESGNSLFAVSSTATVVCGVFIAVLALYWLRPGPPASPAPAPAPPPPEVQYVEKRVEVKVPVERIVEKRIEVKASPPAAKVVSETPGPWDGSWKLPGRSLPMFKIQQTGSTFAGVCATWADTYPFSGGELRDGKLVFAVTDKQLMRVHFRMEMLRNGDARVESWMTPEDVLAMLAKARELPKTPQQADALRRFIAREIKRLGKPIPQGIFRRIADPGEQRADATKGRGQTKGSAAPRQTDGSGGSR